MEVEKKKLNLPLDEVIKMKEKSKSRVETQNGIFFFNKLFCPFFLNICNYPFIFLRKFQKSVCRELKFFYKLAEAKRLYEEGRQCSICRCVP